uniref:Uncharacterized protein n=1 Tax=Globodera rostochiensis TaxID=31243 RepID=A0A914I328_GLORO
MLKNYLTTIEEDDGGLKKLRKEKFLHEELAEAHQKLLLRLHQIAIQSVPGFDTTPFLPNQLQSTGLTGASNFISGNSGSSSYYGGAMPYQEAPMPDTSSFPAFPNYPFNQSAPLNPSTDFVPSQTETDSWDWSGGNSQDNEGDLYSVVNTRKPSSPKSTSKNGKNISKPRK